MKPIGMDELTEKSIKSTTDSDIPNNIFNQQIIELLDKHIPVAHRESYLRLKYGEKIYKAEMSKLYEVIQSILKEHKYEY